MRHGKSIHWHIDTLTEAGTVLGAWTFPGGNECDLVTSLSHLPIAVEGFGSSDCRRCKSHLWDGRTAPEPSFLPMGSLSKSSARVAACVSGGSAMQMLNLPVVP
jgi:Uri superfamily endonuclease